MNEPVPQLTPKTETIAALMESLPIYLAPAWVAVRPLFKPLLPRNPLALPRPADCASEASVDAVSGPRGFLSIVVLVAFWGVESRDGGDGGVA